MQRDIVALSATPSRMQKYGVHPQCRQHDSCLC